MPLYAFDQRACDRLATLRALEALTEEVRQLTPQNAFESGYLRREAKADEDDDDVDERVLERRRKRRIEREAKYVTGEEAEKAVYAKEAALAFLEESRPASNVSIVLAFLKLIIYTQVLPEVGSEALEGRSALVAREALQKTPAGPVRGAAARRRRRR